jgi:hypothetical protein
MVLYGVCGVSPYGTVLGIYTTHTNTCNQRLAYGIDIVGPANQTGCIILRVGNLADEKL